jgi:pyridoxine kinase
VAVLSRWINQVLAEHPDVQVIVDLVIGDHDTGIYVADGMVEAVRELLCRWHMDSRRTISNSGI